MPWNKPLAHGNVFDHRDTQPSHSWDNPMFVCPTCDGCGETPYDADFAPMWMGFDSDPHQWWVLASMQGCDEASIATLAMLAQENDVGRQKACYIVHQMYKQRFDIRNPSAWLTRTVITANKEMSSGCHYR